MTRLELPLVAAAFAGAPTNGHNGHGNGHTNGSAIDLTAPLVSLVDVAHDEEQRAEHRHDLAQ